MIDVVRAQKKYLTKGKKCVIIKVQKRKGEIKAMTYSETELKTWFLKEVAKYLHSNTEQHLKAVFHLMFNEDSKDNLKKVLDKK